MPTVTIKPPRPPSNRNSSSSPQPSTSASGSASVSPPQQSNFTFSKPLPPSIPPNAFGNTAYEAPSPVAPEYSPITPKVQPALPAIASTQNGANTVVPPETNGQQTAANTKSAPEPAIAPTPYIAQPPPQPFSSEDSTDAIALRAAISALQFQKKKAQDDLRSLEVTKKHAVESPQQFREQLVAGRLHEEQPKFGGVQAIIDAAESDSDEDEDSATDAKMGGVGEEGGNRQTQPGARLPEVPDSQPSRPTTSDSKQVQETQSGKPPDFSRIPGPQNVVRMPHINWEKYHIVGEPLEHMHEQQRRWPGSNFAYNQDKGREFAVAAPYSPFQEQLSGQNGQGASDGSRKDSGAVPPTPMSTVSEHPMETRRNSKNQQHQ